MGVGLKNAYIGKYRIIKEIARGGMGAVYKAIHPTLRRTVIIKKLTLKGNKDILERFKREAQIMMDFKNEGIVDVYDHFVEGRNNYIVLEYIDGVSLKELIEKAGKIDEEMALYITREVCSSLKYAHEKNVIHRDIKPANILISRNGDIKLVDFGIASYAETEPDDSLTQEGMTLGTPAYMPPEQFSSTRSVDKRADIYALGIVLYEMLTGKKPYPGAFSTELVRRIEKGHFENPRKTVKKLKRTTIHIIKKSVKVKPSRRYSNMAPLQNHLSRSIPVRDYPELRKRLSSMVTGKDYLPPKKRKPIVGKILLSLGVAVCLFSGGYYLYSSGYYHQVFQRDQFGLVNIRVQVNNSINKNPEEVFVNGWIYKEKDNRLSEMDNTVLSFKYIEDLSSNEIFFYETGKIYLPADNYRIRLALENNLYWDIIFVEPIKVTNEKNPTEIMQTFIYGPPQLNSLPLDLQIRLEDKITGEDISGISRVFLQQQGESIPLEEADNLMTGRVYQLSAQAEGYYTEYYSVNIKSFQSTTDISLKLMPFPAEVEVILDDSSIKCLVDKNDYYLTGLEDMFYQDLENEKENILFLTPGKHEIMAVLGAYQQSLDYDFQSGKRYTLRFFKDSETGSLLQELIIY